MAWDSIKVREKRLFKCFCLREIMEKMSIVLPRQTQDKREGHSKTLVGIFFVAGAHRYAGKKTLLFVDFLLIK
jgi:hypothetical protein